MEDFRKVFNDKVIPEEFDRWRSRYCDELFTDIMKASELAPGKTVLEIGPGTGQATEPILKSGCSYLAIELGKNFTQAMQDRFGSYDNFQIVNADFEKYDFGKNKFDLVYSAATIQWIPEEIAFPKVYDILNNSGTLAMFMTLTDFKTPNEALYAKIQEVYAQHFKPQTRYNKHFKYENAINYGFVNFECRHYHQVREYNADEFIAWTMIQASHLTLEEPYKAKFIKGIREVIYGYGNKITLLNDIVLYLVEKPSTFNIPI